MSGNPCTSGSAYRNCWVVLVVAVLVATTALVVATPSAAAGSGPARAASGDVPQTALRVAPPASGSLSMSPTTFANGAVTTSAVFNGGSFGSGATVTFCLSATVSFSSSTSIGSYSLAAGSTTLSSAVVTIRTSQTAGSYYVAATDGSCGGASSTYTSPVSADVVSSPYPSFSLSNATQTIGSTISVRGGGWDPSATVLVYLGSLAATPAIAGFTTSSAGALPSNASFTVPAGLPQGVYGVFAIETHAGGSSSQWLDFSAPYSGTTNFFSVGPSITVRSGQTGSFDFSGASGSTLSISGQGFRASSTIAANSITIGGIGTTHSSVAVSSSGTFSVSVTTAAAISAVPGGSQTVVVSTSPASSTSSFADAAWVSSPNSGALQFMVSPTSGLSPGGAISAEAWNFPSGASVSFRVGATIVATVVADSLGFAELAASSTLPPMPASTYNALAADSSAGLYSSPVSVTVSASYAATDPSGAQIASEYIPSGAAVTVEALGLTPQQGYVFSDTVYAGASIAGNSIGLAYADGYATVAVAVGSLDAATGEFLPASNGTLLFAYAPLYDLLSSVPSTGTTETIAQSSSIAGTYRVIGAVTSSVGDWQSFQSGSALSSAITFSGLIPQGSTVYPGVAGLSYYYNVYVGTTLEAGLSGSTCSAVTPSTCYASGSPSGTLAIRFTWPAVSGAQSLSVVYLGESPSSSSLVAVPVVLSVAGASPSSGTLQTVTDPVSGHTEVVGYGLLPGASSYTLNVSTAVSGTIHLTPTVTGYGAMAAIDLTAGGYTNEPAGSYAVTLYVHTASGSGTLSATYSVGASLTISSPVSMSGPIGTPVTWSASGLASSGYYDLYFAGTYQGLTYQASSAGAISAQAFTVPDVIPATYSLALAPTGTTSAAVSAPFTVTASTAITLTAGGSDATAAFPSEIVQFDWAPASGHTPQGPGNATTDYSQISVTVNLNGSSYTTFQATPLDSGAAPTAGGAVTDLLGSFAMPNAAPGAYYFVTLTWTQTATYVGVTTNSYTETSPAYIALASGSGALLLSISSATIAEIATLSGAYVNITLAQLNAKLVGIEGGVGYLNTSFGSMQAELSTIGATVTSIQNGVVSLESSVGTIQTSLASIEATLTSFNGTVVELASIVGNLSTTLSAINTTVTATSVTTQQIAANVQSLVGATVEIQTAVGNLTGTVTAVRNQVAIISTGVGSLLTSVSSIQSSTSATQSNTSYVLILLVVTLALAAAAVGIGVVALSRIGRGGQPPHNWQPPARSPPRDQGPP